MSQKSFRPCLPALPTQSAESEVTLLVFALPVCSRSAAGRVFSDRKWKRRRLRVIGGGRGKHITRRRAITTQPGVLLARCRAVYMVMGEDRRGRGQALQDYSAKSPG